MTARTLLAVFLARLAGFFSRLSGRGGSSLPGLIARRIDPTVLWRLASRLEGGTALVTGTNGKTTTSAMIARMLKANGVDILTNRAGANLILGLTATFVQAERWWRIWPRAKSALLETDEATMPRASRELHPKVVVVTNFFRDQLDRYGELSTTIQFVRDGISHMAAGGVLVLNADDPQVAGLQGTGGKPVFYGLEATDDASGFSGYDTMDARFCPQCGTALTYTKRYYAHLGHYRCSSCRFERPHPDVAVLAWDRQDQNMVVRIGESVRDVPWRVPGLYNVYNQVCAIATGVALGIPHEIIHTSFEKFSPAFGRMEQISMGAASWWLALVKNPVGFNQVLSAIVDEKPRSYSVMILINDRYADGQDVSWLWDVDFEYWTSKLHPRQWYLGGIRAKDMAVRLKYAGVERSQVVVDENLPGLLDQAEATLNATNLYVLPTYTAMMELRQHLTRRGLTAHFREG